MPRRFLFFPSRTGVVISKAQQCVRCSGRRIVMAPTQLQVVVHRGAKDGDRVTLRGMAHERPGSIAGYDAPKMQTSSPPDCS